MSLNIKKGIIDYIHKDSKSGTIIFPRTLASAVYDKNGEPISNKLNTGMYKESDTKDNVITFESGDSSSFDSWTDIDILESGETHKSIFKKLSTMIKNVRYLYKLLGTDDISKIGNGTVRGALCSLNTETSNLGKSVADGKSLIANTISNIPGGNIYLTGDSSFESLATAINTVTNEVSTMNYNSGYNAGHSAGYNVGYSAGQSDGSVAGYEQGLTNGKIYAEYGLYNNTSQTGCWIALYYQNTGSHQIVPDPIENHILVTASGSPPKPIPGSGIMSGGNWATLLYDKQVKWEDSVSGDDGATLLTYSYRNIRLFIGHGDINQCISNPNKNLKVLRVF